MRTAVPPTKAGLLLARSGCSSLIVRLLILLLGSTPVLAGLAAETEHVPAATTPALEYMIVVTGEELLRGVYADAHTAFISRTLHLLGGHCLGSMIVDDRSEDIQEALRLATSKARLVIVTGGLGPTMNDVSRGALSASTGIALQESPAILEDMARRFKQSPDQLRPTLRRQAAVPVRGRYLKNPNGTAVGLVFEMATNVVVALPGPPRELQPMVQTELVPYLHERFGVRSPGSMLTLRFVGLGQSQIDQTLREHVPMPPELLVSSLFEGGRVDFTFALPGHGAEDQARLKAIESALRARLGDYLYANDSSTLEDQVVRLLSRGGGSLALVECGSGGHLAASLDGVKGIENVLAAAWAAPTDEQVRRIMGIPEEKWSVWRAGAERVKGVGLAAGALAHSQWAVVVSEITHETAGTAFVWLGVGWPNGRWEVQQVPVQAGGETAHATLTTQILERVRRFLLREEARSK
jgi:nicotinamide-nucleotide amidase